MSKIAIVIAADEPAIFFRRVEDAQNDLEATDVRDGVYTAAYGPGGEPYDIYEYGDSVVISPSGREADPSALKEILMRFLTAVGQPPRSENLADLIECCEKYVE